MGRSLPMPGRSTRPTPVTDPAAFARTLFIEALRTAGCRCDVRQLPATTLPQRLPATGSYGSAKKVAELTSPPLSEDVKLTLKVSQNMHANYYIMLLALVRQQDRVL